MPILHVAQPQGSEPGQSVCNCECYATVTMNCVQTQFLTHCSLARADGLLQKCS